jgi:type I restriction enzyme S subunit
MAGEWETGTLGDIAELVMGQSPTGETCNENGKGVPLLNGPTEFGGSHPKPGQFTTDPRKYAETGDLLFCVRGSTTGRMNWADQRYAIGRGLAAIRPKQGNEYRHFVRAVIDANLPRLLASATGSTFPNVSREQIRKIACNIPPLAEQKAIAAVLGALDDKIELNRRMNATLEAMARALFQSWFVDFDPVRAKLDGRKPIGLDETTAALFPDSFQNSEAGHIPKGWTAGTLIEGFNLTMGQSPPGDTYNEDDNGLPFYQGRTDFGFRFPTRRIYCTAPTRHAQPGDTLVSVRAPVGDINMANEECCIGRGVAAVRHKSGATSFTYHSMANLYRDFACFEAEGTVFGSINKDSFEKLRFVIPPTEIVAAYERQAGPLDEQIRTLENQSRTLATLRDTLLPKLLSGELSVS